MTLRKHSEIHYSLEWGDLRHLNIYPSNQRLYQDSNRSGPYLRVRRSQDNGEAWTLVDVVEAAAAKQKEITRCH